MPITGRNPLPAPQQDEDAYRFAKTFCPTFSKTFAQTSFENICTKLLFPKYAQLPLPDDVIEKEVRNDTKWKRIEI